MTRLWTKLKMVYRQMMKNSFVLILLIVCFASCRSIKTVVNEEVELPHISESRLFKNVGDSALSFETLYAKKIDLTLRDKEKSNSLKAMLRVKRDSFIWISVTAPLGIEVARVLFTPDSVKFINARAKEYLISDYGIFRLLSTHIDESIFRFYFLHFNGGQGETV